MEVGSPDKPSTCPLTRPIRAGKYKRKQKNQIQPSKQRQRRFCSICMLLAQYYSTSVRCGRAIYNAIYLLEASYAGDILVR